MRDLDQISRAKPNGKPKRVDTLLYTYTYQLYSCTVLYPLLFCNWKLQNDTVLRLLLGLLD